MAWWTRRDSLQAGVPRARTWEVPQAPGALVRVHVFEALLLCEVGHACMGAEACVCVCVCVCRISATVGCVSRLVRRPRLGSQAGTLTAHAHTRPQFALTRRHKDGSQREPARARDLQKARQVRRDCRPQHGRCHGCAGAQSRCDACNHQPLLLERQAADHSAEVARLSPRVAAAAAAAAAVCRAGCSACAGTTRAASPVRCGSACCRDCRSRVWFEERARRKLPRPPS
jgi:hypothetical protein